MRGLGAIFGATVAGSIVYGLYNWLLEPLIPDVPVISVNRKVKTEAGEQTLAVPYLTLDNVVVVAAIAAVAVPIGSMIHKLPVVGAVIPAPK